MPTIRNCVLWGVVLPLLVLGFAIGPVSAHFQLNLNVRILHVEHLADGLKVYLRTPMPYLVADRVGPVGPDGLPEPAPYTSNRMEEGKLVYYVDRGQLRDDDIGLGVFAAQGYTFEADDKALEASVEQVRVHAIGEEPDFATLDAAKAVFTTSSAVLETSGPLYVGDTVVDIILRYRAGVPIYEYAVSSKLNPGLPGQEDTANLILDYGPGGTQVFRARGLLAEPVAISRSALSAVFTFIKEGVRHILGGLDHVLFVLCLVLGATQIRNLVWRVTGFTIGHTVTLTAGFFGVVPSGAWFVPAVETGIALSIVYAAAIAVLPRAKNYADERTIFAITCAIGLLHGLGFSFVLHKILQIDSPDIWQSLLAFNVGVEIGQLSIILVVWPMFRLVNFLHERTWQISRLAVAIGCGSVAIFWAVQRALAVLRTL